MEVGNDYVDVMGFDYRLVDSKAYFIYAQIQRSRVHKSSKDRKFVKFTERALTFEHTKVMDECEMAQGYLLYLCTRFGP